MFPQPQTRFPVAQPQFYPPQAGYGYGPLASPPAYFPLAQQSSNSMTGLLALVLLPKEQDTSAATAKSNAEAINSLRKTALIAALSGNGGMGGQSGLILALALSNSI